MSPWAEALDELAREGQGVILLFWLAAWACAALSDRRRAS